MYGQWAYAGTIFFAAPQLQQQVCRARRACASRGEIILVEA